MLMYLKRNHLGLSIKVFEFLNRVFGFMLTIIVFTSNLGKLSFMPISGEVSIHLQKETNLSFMGRNSHHELGHGNLQISTGSQVSEGSQYISVNRPNSKNCPLAFVIFGRFIEGFLKSSFKKKFWNYFFFMKVSCGIE